MVKRFLCLSSMEWAIIGMGCIGAAALFFVFPAAWWRMFICCFGLGFFFEASMEPLFLYNEQLRERHCIGRSDVNYLFPLGWLQIVGLTALIAERLIGSQAWWAYICGALIAGNISEFIFYKCNFWIYNYDAPLVGSFKPFMPKVTAAGVPLQVMIGYANVGFMIWLILKFVVG